VCSILSVVVPLNVQPESNEKSLTPRMFASSSAVMLTAESHR